MTYFINILKYNLEVKKLKKKGHKDFYIFWVIYGKKI